MNDHCPDWYRRLNKNEKRIIDMIVKTGLRFFISRPLFEKQLCETGQMDSRTLTDRFDYLIDKGILCKVRGAKGAAFYAPNFVGLAVRDDPVAWSLVSTSIDEASPKEVLAIPVPVKVIPQSITPEEESELLVRAAETWERVGVGSDRDKSRHYAELRKRRKELRLRAEAERESLDGSP